MKARFQAQSLCRGVLPRLVAVGRAAFDALPQGRQFRFALRPVDPIEPVLVAGNRTGMQHCRTLPAGQRRRRRPRPVFRAAHEVCPQGVSLHVTQDRPQVLVFLDRKRLETPLPDVPARMVVTMVSPHVRGHQPLHPSAQIAVAVRPQHQMKMVGNQTPSKQPHRQPLCRLLHQIEESGDSPPSCGTLPPARCRD